MKIRRPSKPEVPFKRKRRPPPQATKLLRYSFLSGVVFMVLLAIVFLPRMFPDQLPVEILNPNPSAGGVLRLENTTNGTRLFVDASTVSLPLSRFNATFCELKGNFSAGAHSCERDGVVIGALDAGLMTGGNGTLRFVDGTADGLLDAGDYFTVSTSAIVCRVYRVEVIQLDVSKLSGYAEWGTVCP